MRLCEYLAPTSLPLAMPTRLDAAATIVDIFLDGTNISFITSQSYHKERHDHAILTRTRSVSDQRDVAARPLSPLHTGDLCTTVMPAKAGIQRDGGLARNGVVYSSRRRPRPVGYAKASTAGESLPHTRYGGRGEGTACDNPHG